jgi:hypothetical protein
MGFTRSLDPEDLTGETSVGVDLMQEKWDLVDKRRDEGLSGSFKHQSTTTH